jgi:hypothetical protein
LPIDDHSEEYMAGITEMVYADALREAKAEIRRLRAALTECAAEYRSPPCTLGSAMGFVGAEFKRRMEVARDALNVKRSAT